MSTRLPSAGRALLLLLILVAAAVGAERGRWFPRLLAAHAPERQWIWVDAWPREVRPRAFFLARDFELAAPPASARLEVLVDPEYVVRLNGARIGSASYRAAAPVDVYEVGPELRAGRNRIVVEVRSPIGSGGATVRLADADGRTIVGSDDEWGIYGGAWRALMDLDQPLFRAGRATVLGRTPFGRWGVPPERPRASFRELVERDGLEPARFWRRVGTDAAWRELPGRRRNFGGGELVEVDFGRVVSGYLHLDFEPRGAPEGIVFFAEAPADRLDRAPDRVVVAVPNLGFWQDTEPRRFRYVTLVGLDDLSRIAVVPVLPRAIAESPPPTAPRGLLGAAVEPTRSPLEEELRRRLLLAGEAAP